MYVCMCLHVFTCAIWCVPAYACAYICLHMQCGVHIRVCTCIHVFMCTYLHMYVYVANFLRRAIELKRSQSYIPRE